MKTMTAKQAAQYCKQVDCNKLKRSYNCGYSLEVKLELDHNILLENESSWTELENILFYKL